MAKVTSENKNSVAHQASESADTLIIFVCGDTRAQRERRGEKDGWTKICFHFQINILSCDKNHL